MASALVDSALVNVSSFVLVDDRLVVLLEEVEMDAAALELSVSEVSGM